MQGNEVQLLGPAACLARSQKRITAIEGPQEKKNPLADSEAEWQSLDTQEKARRIEREMRRQGAK